MIDIWVTTQVLSAFRRTQMKMLLEIFQIAPNKSEPREKLLHIWGGKITFQLFWLDNSKSKHLHLQLLTVSSLLYTHRGGIECNIAFCYISSSKLSLRWCSLSNHYNKRREISSVNVFDFILGIANIHNDSHSSLSAIAQRGNWRCNKLS